MKKQLSPRISPIRILSIAVLVIVLVSQIFPIGMASAAQITARSLTLQAGATDGGSKPSGVVNHFFSFTIPTAGNVGSIKFEYCTLAAGTCTAPTGLTTTSATLGSETGVTGFTMVNTTDDAPYLTRTAANVAASTPVTYQLATITNPSTTNQTFFVRISTYTEAALGGTITDTGVVAASTATPIELEGIMPESLVFCTGATVTTTLGVPDCATATAGTVDFNQLFSPTDTATATSQMAASTNAGTGYVISVNGLTMYSGTNFVPAMGSMTTGVRGTGQFGMNLKANTVSTSTPAVGIEVTPAANATNYRGQAATNYDTVDNFKFTSGDSVANSANGGAGGTDAQIFTASYVVNVPGSQPAGTYTTTLTYICTPTY
jgi:hypothetical protein